MCFSFGFQSDGMENFRLIRSCGYFLDRALCAIRFLVEAGRTARLAAAFTPCIFRRAVLANFLVFIFLEVEVPSLRAARWLLRTRLFPSRVAVLTSSL
jgi:hypothetical protein